MFDLIFFDAEKDAFDTLNHTELTLISHDEDDGVIKMITRIKSQSIRNKIL